MDNKKIYEFDFAKGILIILMVLFHIELIENTYPILRNIVYSFHMYGFLIISGYLANFKKNTHKFIAGNMRIFIPYIFFELIYVLLKFFLGFNKETHAREFGIKQLIEYIILNPQGPYWYLHTLIICLTIYYLVRKTLKLNINNSFIIIACFIYGFSLIISGFHWSNAIYFIVGAYIRNCNLKLEKVLSVSVIVIFPIMFLFYHIINFPKDSLSDLFITILMLGLFFNFYTHCAKWLKRILVYLGNNTLTIVVFSPIFTATSKLVQVYFSFDSSGITFATITVTYVITASLLSSKLCDVIGISKLLFYKEKIYVSYE